MKVAVLHSEVSDDAPKDEQDSLTEVSAVCGALRALGHIPTSIPFSSNIKKTIADIKSASPDMVFNLVETIESTGELHYVAPSVLDTLRIPYTGSSAETLFLTSNKILTKEILKLNNIPTPDWVYLDKNPMAHSPKPGRYIIKPVWEDASFGISDDSVVEYRNTSKANLRKFRERLSDKTFAEVFIDGKEVNVALIAGENGVDVLPPSRIEFVNYPPHKPKIVGYEAKWEEDSFEFKNTQRSFSFADDEEELIDRVKGIALRCWNIFGLRGYARIDFRVDSCGVPYVLEINANPCISPDSGFFAALMQEKIEFKDAIARIIDDGLKYWKGSEAKKARRIPPDNDLKQTITTIETAVSTGAVSDLAKSPTSIFLGVSKEDSQVIYRDYVTEMDKEVVRELVSGAGNFSEAETKIAVELVVERLTKGLSSDYYFIFAHLNGEVAGYTCFGPIPGTSSSHDLYWIVVKPQFRKRGLGAKLLEQTERLICKMGGKRVFVHTSSRMEYKTTRDFYERCGYRTVARLKDFYSEGDDKLVYEKGLVPPIDAVDIIVHTFDSLSAAAKAAT
ncbi:MAG: hypothetical protein Kow0090_15630 [Myxococcota bacterium]